MNEDIRIMLYNEVCFFISEHDISCVEDVHQRDSVNEDCVDLVAELVAIILECEERGE